MGSKTSVKVTAFSTGLTTIALWIIGVFIPELAAQMPLGIESALVGMIAAVVGWITPNPND